MRWFIGLLMVALLSGCTDVPTVVEVDRYPGVEVHFPDGSRFIPATDAYDAAVAPDCTRLAVIKRFNVPEGHSWDAEKSSLQFFVLGPTWPTSQSAEIPGIWWSPKFSEDATKFAILKEGQNGTTEVWKFNFQTGQEVVAFSNNFLQRIDAVAWDEENILIRGYQDNAYVHYSLTPSGQLLQIAGYQTPSQFEVRPYQERFTCVPEGGLE